MPARSTRVYIVQQHAPQTGLAFATPPWWDVAQLLAVNAHRRIVLPDGREVFLLDWPDILDFDVKTGKKTWRVPERPVEDAETEQARAALLAAVQEAKWFVVERERVWMVPKRSRPGCEVWDEPIWWQCAFGVADFSAWYQRFRETHGLHRRRFEMSNPIWSDDVSLLTGPEAQALDERARAAYRVWKAKIGQTVTAHDRREMARFARALEQAVWVVLYHYEWESGLS